MGHRCDYIAKLESKGKIYYKLYAKYKKKSAYVYKEYLDGTAFGRYMNYTHLGGYTVTFPGESYNSWSYYGKMEQRSEKMSRYYPVNVYSVWVSREKDLKELELNYPKLKYFIKKQHIYDIRRFMVALGVYMEHPEVEPLIELNLVRVATDKRLYKLTEKKRKEVLNYIRKHKDELDDEISLQNILCMILDEKGLYRPRTRGEKKLADMKRIEEYNPNLMKISGYSIFIPNSVEQCKLQADKLNQCIISCNYVRDMGKRKLVLIFIQKDGNPIATCEINHNKEIKQFYADEHNRERCLPTRKMRNAMDEYIKNLDLNNLYVGA